MITLSQINQYAKEHSLGEDADIFSILSQMQLEHKAGGSKEIPHAPVASHVEWTTEEVLNLFSS